MGQMKATVIDLHDLVKGNGKDGLVTDMANVKLTLGRMEMAVQTSVLWGKVIAGLLTLLLLLIGTIFTVEQVEARKSGFLFPKLGHAPALSRSQQGDMPPGWVPSK
jgi:hypothetical protein